jgi:thioredoxin-like negative regulator of GroEL
MSRRERLEEMLRSDPDDIFLHYALAKEFLSEGDTATGLERLGQVIDRDPDYVAAYFQKGQVLAEQGETEAAREVIARGIEAARRTGDAHAEEEMTGFLEML